MTKYLQHIVSFGEARPGSRRFSSAVAVAVVVGLSFAGGSVMVAGGASAQQSKTFAARLAAAGVARTKHHVVYDPAYRVIAYPGGDVPADRGVCTDVVIRSYRVLGIDLQKLVHEDMRSAFRTYPKRWGLKRPDRNIDHRRVANLRRFFIRHGESLPVSASPADYRPGDLVTWDLAVPYRPETSVRTSGLSKVTSARTPHIGIVTAQMSSDGKRPLIAHNIGAGTELSDVLFTYRITGRYRYHPGS